MHIGVWQERFINRNVMRYSSLPGMTGFGLSPSSRQTRAELRNGRLKVPCLVGIAQMPVNDFRTL